MKLRDVVAGANASMYYRLDFKRIKGVFYPRTEQDVVDAIAKAKEKGYDVTPKGGGSGLSAGCTGGNSDRIMITSLQMNEILTISKEQGYADVQCGASPDEINELLAPLDFQFFVSPSSRDIATIGGLINTDGGGNDTWVNGTMRDNTISLKMVLYDGRRLTVDWNGVKSEDSDLENALNEKGMTIHDVASSHGTLGYVTELRVKIQPIIQEDLIGAVAHYEDFDALGNAIDGMIKKNLPIRYGEAIVEAHPDVKEGMKPPLLILQCPEGLGCFDELKEVTDCEPADEIEIQRLKDIRIKLPKRNPKEGVQAPLFEGYGLHAKSLTSMQHSMEEINKLLRSNGFEPFGKYGHAPSKWYLGDNTEAYGLVMHSREIRPTGKSGKEIFATVSKIVDLCMDLGITPKPEHKWPFSDHVKLTRLQTLREVIGQGFNGFMFEDNCQDVLASMV